MTSEEIREVTILQKRGLGYSKISKITKLPVNSVKSYVARHPAEEEDVCLQCGKMLSHTAHHRRKSFCSPDCKNKWWYAHSHMMTKQTLNDFTCPVCGQKFQDYGHRIYCSVSCYAEARRKRNG